MGKIIVFEKVVVMSKHSHTPKKRVLRVEANAHRSLLKDFLAQHLNLSGKQAKHLLDARLVFVNNRRIWMSNHTLNKGDHIEVIQKALPFTYNKNIILYEDNFYLIVNKPSGITSNGPKSLEIRLASALDNPELVVAHRLDKDTTGCLIVAKNELAQTHMIQLFRERLVQKEYYAIVKGCIKKECTISKSLEGKPAESRLSVIAYNHHLSYIKVRILTGRKHQIRRHLAAIHHPVLGDKEYGPRKALTISSKTVQRQMLHARSVSFNHPMLNKNLQLQAPLPKDFQDCLSQYNLTAEPKGKGHK